MEIEKPPMSVDSFKVARYRILNGNTEEFERVQQLFTLTIEQFNALSEAHELAIKSVQ